MPNDPIQAIEFAQSKGQARRDGRTGITFADVAGCDEAVRELRSVVEVSILCNALLLKTLWQIYEHISFRGTILFASLKLVPQIPSTIAENTHWSTRRLA